MRTAISSSNLVGSDPQCVHCGRSLAGYDWKFKDGTEGYICTATHEQTDGDVAFMQYRIANDEWVLAPKE